MIAPLGTYSQQQQQPGPQAVVTLQVPLTQGWPGATARRRTWAEWREQVAQNREQLEREYGHMRHGNEVPTPNPECPACQAKRLHTPKEKKLYHPLAGTGFTRASGGA